jgi:plastocyanin
MRRTAVLLSLAALTVAAIALPAYAATRSVKIGDDYFVRSSGTPTVTVKRGDTVRFRNTGASPHNVVVTRGPVKFRSGTIRSGRTYAKKLTRRGTYTIVCSIHPPDQRMKLRVR